MDLIDRIRIVLPFWILSAFYFLIPFLIDPINAPSTFIYTANQIPFVWWMIVPYYLYYFGLLLPVIINNKMGKKKLKCKNCKSRKKVKLFQFTCKCCKKGEVFCLNCLL